MQQLRLLVAERDEAGVHLLADEEEHIDERDLIGGEIARELAVFRLLGGIGRVDDLRSLVVKACKLGELARRELIGEHIAIERFDVGKAHRGVDLVVLAELVQNGGFLVVIARGDDEREHIL